MRNDKLCGSDKDASLWVSIPILLWENPPSSGATATPSGRAPPVWASLGLSAPSAQTTLCKSSAQTTLCWLSTLICLLRSSCSVMLATQFAFEAAATLFGPTKPDQPQVRFLLLFFSHCVMAVIMLTWNWGLTNLVCLLRTSATFLLWWGD
jgi:hypothetical protein